MRIVLPLLALSLAACGEEDDGMAVTPCSEESRAGPISVGTTAGAPEDGFVTTLQTAEPAPPEVGENTWSFRLTDGDGQVLDGCDVGFFPTMPDHGHGTPTDPVLTDLGDGTHQAVFELSMGGYWRVDIEATCGDDPVRSAVYHICAAM
jgi:hypothetical protein